jgi:hypothetical protein
MSNNWNIVPDDFDYLIEPCEKYGSLSLGGGAFQRRLKRREIEELATVADRIAYRRHRLAIESWLLYNGYRGTSSPEANLVDGLIALLDRHELDTSDLGVQNEHDFLREQWRTLHHQLFLRIAERTREVFSDEEAFTLTQTALNRVPPPELGTLAFFLLYPFRTSRTLDWIEQHPPEVVSENWGYLAALSEITWHRIRSWLEEGRPLSLIALDTLTNFSGQSKSPVIQEFVPQLLDPVSSELALRVVSSYSSSDPAPRVKRAANLISEHIDQIMNVSGGSSKGLNSP